MHLMHLWIWAPLITNVSSYANGNNRFIKYYILRMLVEEENGQQTCTGQRIVQNRLIINN